MEVKFLKRSFFQRIFGIPATGQPADAAAWSYADGRVTVELNRVPELAAPGGAVRLEGRGLPQRVLLFRGEDGAFHAFHNRCTHLGHRRLDPVPGTATVQCCSVNKSTYDLEGRKVHGPAPRPITPYPVETDGERLVIRIV